MQKLAACRAIRAFPGIAKDLENDIDSPDFISVQMASERRLCALEELLCQVHWQIVGQWLPSCHMHAADMGEPAIPSEPMMETVLSCLDPSAKEFVPVGRLDAEVDDPTIQSEGAPADFMLYTREGATPDVHYHDEEVDDEPNVQAEHAMVQVRYHAEEDDDEPNAQADAGVQDKYLDREEVVDPTAQSEYAAAEHKCHAMDPGDETAAQPEYAAADFKHHNDTGYGAELEEMYELKRELDAATKSWQEADAATYEAAMAEWAARQAAFNTQAQKVLGIEDMIIEQEAADEMRISEVAADRAMEGLLREEELTSASSKRKPKAAAGKKKQRKR